MKRLFDIVLSIAGIIALSPVMLIAAIAVKLSSRGPVFFQQTRIGKDFKPFRILKFRSMIVDAESVGAQVTVDRDPRITLPGRWLRKTKLDELPQLFNVLRGDMSFVGPRPEVKKYVDIFRDDYVTLLSVRPGITGVAAIEYRNEEEILAASSDPLNAYIEEIAPAKIKLDKQYVAEVSLLTDIALIFKTLSAVVNSKKSPSA